MIENYFVFSNTVISAASDACDKNITLPECPATPTCPTQSSQCNTNLFAISTGINNMVWNVDYSNPNSDAYKNAVQNISDSLTQSLISGLNTASSLYRILAAMPSNNIQVQISALRSVLLEI